MAIFLFSAFFLILLELDPLAGELYALNGIENSISFSTSIGFLTAPPPPRDLDYMLSEDPIGISTSPNVPPPPLYE